MNDMEKAFDEIAMKVASNNLTNASYQNFLGMSDDEHLVENIASNYGLLFDSIKICLI